jgi:hemerythrin superfamily protein
MPDTTIDSDEELNPGGGVAAPDAIALLEADHREVDGLFRAYEDLSDPIEKKALARRICLALKAHAQIEEEIFYPAARALIDDAALLDEALVEHMGAKTLIVQIEGTPAGEGFFDAMVKVLGEQVRHHVEEEEGELFPSVRAGGADLAALGARLATRKAQVLALLAPDPA